MIFTVFSKIHVYKNHSAVACWNYIILNRAGTLTGSPHAFKVIIFWLHPKVRSTVNIFRTYRTGIPVFLGFLHVSASTKIMVHPLKAFATRRGT